MYLWEILRRNKGELIRKVYKVQKVKKTKGDWFQMVQIEKEKYNICLTDDEIAKMSKYSFKKVVDKKVNSFAFNFLKDKSEKHSKSQNILKELKGQTILKRKSYLKENVLHKNNAQLLFSLRSKMLDVK